LQSSNSDFLECQLKFSVSLKRVAWDNFDLNLNLNSQFTWISSIKKVQSVQNYPLFRYSRERE
jgi:hypothetical protein